LSKTHITAASLLLTYHIYYQPQHQLVDSVYNTCIQMGATDAK